MSHLISPVRSIRIFVEKLLPLLSCSVALSGCTHGGVRGTQGQDAGSSGSNSMPVVGGEKGGAMGDTGGGAGTGGSDGLDGSGEGCGSSCRGTCNSGRCLITLASGLYGGSPRLLGVDSTNVYFVALYASELSVMKAPVEGGTPVVLASWPSSPEAVTVGAGAVYWIGGSGAVDPGRDAGQAVVMTVATGGGAPVTRAGGRATLGMGGDATNLYWTAGSMVMKMLLDGGTPIKLATGQDVPGDIAVDDTSVYWVNGGSPRPGASTWLMKIPLGGGVPATLASIDVVPSKISLAIDATHAYWTESVFYLASLGSTTCTLGKVMRVPIAGGPTTTLAADQNCPTGITVDATAMYWVNQGTRDDGSVMKLPLSGDTPVTLVAGQSVIGGAIVVDDRHVYWTTAAVNSYGALVDGQGAVIKTLKN